MKEGNEMKNLKGYELRQMWYDFWESKEHEIIESASLLPKNDPTLLWIGAGVAALKKYFDGSVVPNNRRMAGSQKCIRTTDIDIVGRTSRHHTFFEMLGNFSIGDYFKEEAIEWALEFLTDEKWINFDIDKLYMTIYPSDTKAKKQWMSLGVDESHIIPIEHNFWEIGPGPSGPDSEIFYDRGESYDKDNIGIKLLEEDLENDRYIEIWNVVFSQFNATEGLERSEYPELPSKNIDTGMGLERMLSILQGVDSNFDTDLFIPIMEKVSEISNVEYQGQMAFKVIADHARTVTFALSDGASFSNTGRGYVLRRLLRRAASYGKKLGIKEQFISNLVPVVVEIMEEHYPELRTNIKIVTEKISKEESLFMKTLVSGEKRLEEIFKQMSEDGITELDGAESFKLYDTYGFPYELTLEYAEEKGFTAPKDVFDKYMEKQKQLARDARKDEASMNVQNEELLNFKDDSTFIGYDDMECEGIVIALMEDECFVNENKTNKIAIAFDRTPFYAEKGGQVADTGTISGENFEGKVLDVVTAPNDQHFHITDIVKGNVKVGDKLSLKIDNARRLRIRANHSSIHLLQKTMKDILGEEIKQAGSKVDENSFRFDFTYSKEIKPEDIVNIENELNQKIGTDRASITEELSIKDAKATGAIAVFDEKYGDKVRVVTIGDSKELCGGTHIHNLNEIKRVAISNIESKGSNVYRISGSTNEGIKNVLLLAINPLLLEMDKLKKKADRIISDALSNDIKLEFEMPNLRENLDSYQDVIDAGNEMKQLSERLFKLEKVYNEKKIAKILSDLSVFTDKQVTTDKLDYIITKTEGLDGNSLKEISSSLVNQMNKGFVFLANINGNSVQFVAKANPELKAIINCGTLVREASLKSNGNGGGSPFYAQGGGSTSEYVDSILKEIISSL